MELRSLEASPQPFARLAGALYLVVIVAGGFAEGFVRSSLVASGDAAATARNIAASPGLWNLGIAADLLLVPCALALALLEYRLLRPAGRDLAAFTLALNVVSIAVETIDRVVLLGVEAVLRGGSALEGLGGAAQREALAYVFLRLHGACFHVSLLLFGLVCVGLGLLTFRSGYLPRAVGLLLGLGGIAYVVASTCQLFFPAIEERLLPYILLPPLLGELSSCLWLLFRGVDLPRWRERLAAAAP